jgi:hypothetical protein
VSQSRTQTRRCARNEDGFVVELAHEPQFSVYYPLHMKRKSNIDSPSQQQIDQLYGLEPVFEPDTELQSGTEPTDFVAIACPYCGESYGTQLDLSAGSSTYIEDCQVCCQPIELRVTVNAEGALLAVEPQRCE